MAPCATKPCPFCKMERLTDWYFTQANLVICRDLSDAGYAYRILAVYAGKRFHRERLQPEQEKHLEQALVAVAKAHVASGKARKYVINRVCRSVSDHWHLQACMIA